jgi:hypothetical protein
MFKEERNVAKDGGENIGGIIRAMQCKCSCDTVNAFTEKVFNDATSSWPADQSKEFKRAMTAIIPGQWPKSLKP